MQLVIFVIFFCSIVFLYALHQLVEDDFVILRKNVTTEKIFNVAIAIGVFGIIIARLFHVLFNPKPVYFEILGFLLFPYFPGLSLIGGLVGSLALYIVLSRRGSFPVARVFDFLSKSFLIAAPFGVLGILILNLKLTQVLLINLLVYVILFVITIVLTQRGEKWLKDGSFGFLSLIAISLIWIASSFIQSHLGLRTLFYKENPVAIALLLSSLALLVKNEVTRIKRNGR